MGCGVCRVHARMREIPLDTKCHPATICSPTYTHTQTDTQRGLSSPEQRCHGSSEKSTGGHPRLRDGAGSVNGPRFICLIPLCGHHQLETQQGAHNEGHGEAVETGGGHGILANYCNGCFC
ncbi:hypothetical protein TcG_11089 [Trypanosoma cruzi]|nr:hypothetical protein TcG_11089 [Trypanosoma cruzi]